MYCLKDNKLWLSVCLYLLGLSRNENSWVSSSPSCMSMGVCKVSGSVASWSMQTKLWRKSIGKNNWMVLSLANMATKLLRRYLCGIGAVTKQFSAGL
jgi:hypothetical protein